MTQEDVERLIASLESRFVSWKSLLTIILPLCLLAFSLPIGVTMFLLSQHENVGSHTGSLPRSEAAIIETASEVRLRSIENRLGNIERVLEDLRVKSR